MSLWRDRDKPVKLVVANFGRNLIMITVCAVVVTYNRKELLFRNIHSLLRQTCPLDILIYDNASTDGTYSYLKEKKILDNERIIYINGGKNRGGAGGFCNGEREACMRGYELIWLMDDDGYCINENTLGELLKYYNPGRKNIINSYIICNLETKELTFDLGPYTTDDEVQKAAKDNVIYGFGNAYNGTLVPRKCFEEIGYTDERFFIYGDECDFVIRTNNAGYEWITPLKSLYFHPINRNIKFYTFCGIKYSVKTQPIWKFYLETRNFRYLAKKYMHQKTVFKTIIRIVLISLKSKDKKLKRIKWGLIAINDGTKEYFGRPIPFKE